MTNISLFYATNRNHEGDDRWNPTGYGQNFSSDRSSNLRFGKVELTVDPDEISKFINGKKNGRSGNGVGLSEYLAKKSTDEANIKAFKDITVGGAKAATTDQLASTRIFREMKKLMDGQQDFIINIHGFNVSWWQAVGAAMSLQLMLNRQSDCKNVNVFLFSWPSNGKMMQGRAYASDRSDAKDSGLAVARGFLKLRDFLMTLKSKTNDSALKECRQDLHLLCHSMGNYVFQKALRHLRNEVHTPALPRLFKNIFMCAPDVGDNIFEKDQPMNDAHELCRNLSVYFNEGDVAMYISDFTKGNSERLGHAGAARPNHLHNKIQQVDCSDIVEGVVEHSYYLWATVNDDIRQSVDGVGFRDTVRKRVESNTNTSALK